MVMCVLWEGEGVVSLHGALGELRDALEGRRDDRGGLGVGVGVGEGAAAARRRGDVHELRVRQEEAGEVAGRRDLEAEHRLRGHHAPVLVGLGRVPLEHRRGDPVRIARLLAAAAVRRREPFHELRRRRRGRRHVAAELGAVLQWQRHARTSRGRSPIWTRPARRLWHGATATTTPDPRLVERSGAGPNASSAHGMHGTGRGARYFWPHQHSRPTGLGRLGCLPAAKLATAAALVSLQRASGGEMRSPIRRRRPASTQRRAAPRRTSEPRGARARARTTNGMGRTSCAGGLLDSTALRGFVCKAARPSGRPARANKYDGEGGRSCACAGDAQISMAR